MASVISTSSQASWRDLLELTKPKVVLLMLITSLIGMLLATKAGVPWQVLVFGNLGIGLCAGGAAAVNHVVDRRIDSIMARTTSALWPKDASRHPSRWASPCCCRSPGWQSCWCSPTS